MPPSKGARSRVSSQSKRSRGERERTVITSEATSSRQARTPGPWLAEARPAAISMRLLVGMAMPMLSYIEASEGSTNKDMPCNTTTVTSMSMAG